MSMTLAEIEAEAMKLPPEERKQLIDTLAISLDDPEDIDEEWRIEIARRIEEVQTGAVQLIPVEQVLAEIDAERAAEQARR